MVAVLDGGHGLCFPFQAAMQKVTRPPGICTGVPAPWVCDAAALFCSTLLAVQRKPPMLQHKHAADGGQNHPRVEQLLWSEDGELTI